MCGILTAFCLRPENMSGVLFKENRLLCLAEEISRQETIQEIIQAVARSLLTALTEAPSEREKGVPEREDEVWLKGCAGKIKVSGKEDWV